MQTGKRKRWFVLVIVECIKIDAARSQVFAFRIDDSITLTVTRHFQSSNLYLRKYVNHLLFYLQTDGKQVKSRLLPSAVSLILTSRWRS